MDTSVWKDQYREAFIEPSLRHLIEFPGFCSKLDSGGLWGKPSDENSVTPILKELQKQHYMPA
jgi:hypothetical protein